MQTAPAYLPQSKKGKIISLLIKISITLICFWYISTKIDFTGALNALLTAEWSFFTLAILTYILSKVIAAYRLNIYFKNINLYMPQWQNIKLYWLGMFYNFFLPGSIGGDAYKVILLTKRFKTPYKKTTTAVLLDRFSGLLALGVILSIYGLMVINDRLIDILLIGGSLLAIAGLYVVIRLFFKDFLPGFWPTFALGLLVQLCQAGGLYLILASLNIPVHVHEWIFIFLAASVVSVLPISLGGGLGTRELVFAEGARFFHLDPQLGVIISLLFYISTMFGSLWGFYFVFYDPLQDKTAP
jgi:uncharacterized membrane protein YbhN (UPF0104 family)